MNTKFGPILTKTNVINFMTNIGLRLGMLVNTTQRPNFVQFAYRESTEGI